MNSLSTGLSCRLPSLASPCAHKVVKRLQSYSTLPESRKIDTVAEFCIMRKLISHRSTLPNKLSSYEVYKKSYAPTQMITFQKRFIYFIFIILGSVGTVNLRGRAVPMAESAKKPQREQWTEMLYVMSVGATG